MTSAAPPSSPSPAGPGHSTPAQPRRRFDTIDAYRGIAVIGVVFSHAVIGVGGEGLLEEGSRLTAMNEWMYAFRMPAIALVLGLFISSGVNKYGTRGYIARRAVVAVYLYLVWYVIQMGAEIATSSVKNHPVTFSDAIQVWSPPAHLWFIPYIAVSALVIALVRPWDRLPWLTLPLLVGFSIAGWGWAPNIVGLRGLSLLGFSAVGACIGVRRFGSWLDRWQWPIIAAGIASFIASVMLRTYEIVPASVAATPEEMAMGRGAWLLPSVAMAWLGQFILAGAAIAAMKIPVVGRALAAVGRHTLSVYLAHIIVIAGFRIILVRLGVDSVPVLMTVLMIAGVGLPLLAERMVRGTPLRYVFDTPPRLLRWAGGSAERKRA